MEKRGKTIFRKAIAATALIALVAVSVFFGYRFAERNWIYPKKYEEIVTRHARAFGLEESLVYGLIKTESGFDKKAQSRAGALGLMQLTPSTAEFVSRKLGTTEYDLFDADTNVLFGCCYLWYLSRRFSDLSTILAAYNAGEGNVALWLKDEKYSSDGITLYHIPYGETRFHVKKTLKYKAKYESLYGL